jgi:RNA polymerase sigma-70 factor (ECF subfamily)
MYRTAAGTLRGSSRESDAEDAVMSAMTSLMANPPMDVKNWEALMVATTRRRALDMVKKASVRHASSRDPSDHDEPSDVDVEDDAIEAVDRQRAAAVALDKLTILDERHRKVAWEYIALGRPRKDVANELRVSPARVSQMAAEALKQVKEALEDEGVHR